jgi:hypothetical protein
MMDEDRYADRVERYKTVFPDGYAFLKNLERKGRNFNISSTRNAHFYLGNRFLFRIELEEGFHSINILDKYRGPIKGRTIKDKSVDFFEILNEEAKKKNSSLGYKIFNIEINESSKDFFRIIDDSIEQYYGQYAK